MLTALTNGRVLTDQGTVERCAVLLDGIARDAVAMNAGAEAGAMPA